MITLALAVATVVLAKPPPTPPPPVMCCVNGKVVAEPNGAACLQAGGFGLFGGNIHVGDKCGSGTGKTCWCCKDGNVFQMLQFECQNAGGKCYKTKEQALKGCDLKH